MKVTRWDRLDNRYDSPVCQKDRGTLIGMAGLRNFLRFEWSIFRHAPLEWLLLTGDRRIVSLLQALVLLVLLSIPIAVGIVPLVHETAPLFLLFALIAANFTLIAIVTSLSQLVIGRRIETPGEIRAKIDEAIAFREDVGKTTATSIMPVRPDSFFLSLFSHARIEIDTIRERTSEGRTRRTREELASLADGLDTHVSRVESLLNHPSSQLKHALFASLNTGYETHVHRVWYLEVEHAEELTDRVGDPLRRLSETLVHIVVASRLFTSSFIESELAELSRYLLYVGIPVQISAVVTMLLYSAPDAAPVIAHETLVVLFPIVLTAAFTPFLILAAYIVRLTIVARRTSDTFPFSTQLQSSIALEDPLTGTRRFQVDDDA